MRTEEAKRSVDPPEEDERVSRRQRLEHVSGSRPADDEDFNISHPGLPQVSSIDAKTTGGFYYATADCEFDVSEVFSVPRVCGIAKEKGWKPGFSIDIAQEDAVTGKFWDHSK